MNKKTSPGSTALLLPPYPYYSYFERGDELPFEPNAQSLSLANAWRLIEASQLAYEQPNLVRAACFQAGFDDLIYFDNGSTQCYVAVSGKKNFAILSFRGTGFSNADKLLDVIADISVGRVPFGPGFAHKGFSRVLLSVWDGSMSPLGVSWAFTDGLKKYLDMLFARQSRLKLFITGHSLGGALATLSASLEPRCAGLYTFGAPMSADSSVMQALLCPHFRFTNGNDPVPVLPPPDLMEKLFKYRYIHGGSLCRIGQDGNLVLDPKVPDEKTLADFLTGNLKAVLDSLSKRITPENRLSKARKEVARTPFIEDLNDHTSASYNARLWNLAMREKARK